MVLSFTAFQQRQIVSEVSTTIIALFARRLVRGRLAGGDRLGFREMKFEAARGPASLTTEP